MSTKVMWKYEINESGIQHKIPQGAKVRHTHMQNDIPCIWMEVDPEAKKETRRFVVIGTGFDFNDEDLTYIGTCLTATTRFVWHIYETSNIELNQEEDAN